MPDKSKQESSPISRDGKDETQDAVDAPVTSHEGAAIEDALSLMADTIAADRAFARDARVAISAVEDSEEQEGEGASQKNGPGRDE